MRGVAAVCKRENGLKEGQDVAENAETVGDASSSEGVGDVKEGNVKGFGENGRSFEGGGELFGVDLDESDEGVDTGGDGILPDDVFWRETARWLL